VAHFEPPGSVFNGFQPLPPVSTLPIAIFATNRLLEPPAPVFDCRHAFSSIFGHQKLFSNEIVHFRSTAHTASILDRSQSFSTSSFHFQTPEPVFKPYYVSSTIFSYQDSFSISTSRFHQIFTVSETYYVFPTIFGYQESFSVPISRFPKLSVVFEVHCLTLTNNSRFKL
jgi:hypothetical protein